MNKPKVRAEEDGRILALAQDEFYLLFGIMKVTNIDSSIQGNMTIETISYNIVIPMDTITKIIGAFEKVGEKLGLTDKVYKKILYYKELVEEDTRHNTIITSIKEKYKIY